MPNGSHLICFQTPVLNPSLCWRSDKRGKLRVEQDGWREHRVERLGRCPDGQLELVKWWSGREGSKYWELSLAGKSSPVPACGMCLEKRNTAHWWWCCCCWNTVKERVWTRGGGTAVLAYPHQSCMSSERFIYFR